MRPASDDGDRLVRVPPERLSGWLERFAARHGEPALELTPAALRLTSPDGAAATLTLIWGPLPGVLDPRAELIEAMLRERRVAVLLVRRSAHAVGIVRGTEIEASKVGRHYVQGRTKAGGWSQQRYARRRGHQAEHAFEAAADDAVAVLAGRVGQLEALLLGGDAPAVKAVLADPRLAKLAALPRHAREVFPVPDPRRAILDEFPARYRAVPIRLNDLAQLTAPSGPQGDEGTGER